MEYEPADLFAVMADATRLRCLMLLKQAESLCVCHLVDALKEPQPKLSKHLGVLREMGLVTDERKAQWVYYSLRGDLPGWVQHILDAAIAGAKNQQPYLDDSQRLAQRLASRQKAA